MLIKSTMVTPPQRPGMEDVASGGGQRRIQSLTGCGCRDDRPQVVQTRAGQGALTKTRGTHTRAPVRTSHVRPAGWAHEASVLL